MRRKKNNRPEPTITGPSSPDIRIPTGLWGLDAATNGGLPAWSNVMLYGPTKIGKTTLGIYLACMVDLKGHVLITDLERLQDTNLQAYIQSSGFSGTFERVPMKGHDKEKGKEAKTITRLLPDQRARLMIDMFAEQDDVNAAILDSVGALIFEAGVQGELTDALMGKRAQIMTRWIERMVYELRFKEQPSISIVVNHQNKAFGWGGFTTPGGDRLKALSELTIQLGRFKSPAAEEQDSYVAQGTVRANRNGPPGYTFKVFLKGGYGVHPGLTAVYDCVDIGLAETSKTVKLGRKTFGSLSKLIGDKYDDEKIFEPFKAALEKYYESHEAATASSSVSESDEPDEVL